MTEIPEEVMKRAAVIGHSEQIRSLPFETRVFLTEVIANALMAERNSRASLSSELDRLREENARLRIGLSFYADQRNYIDSPSWDDGDPSCITEKCIPVSPESGRPCDCGDVARAALSPDNSTQKKEGEI